MINSIDSVVDGSIHRLGDRRTEGRGRTGDEAPAASTGPERSADLLNLTGRTRALKALEQDLAKAPEIDARRVSELKDALASGRYEVNADRIAEKLLAMESKLP